MLKTRDLDISEFIKITAAGIEIADFTDVRASLINRYKFVYGSDIDLSTGSADGIYVNDLALIINNILQSIKTMYGNLDVNTASGVYLDALCRLANVTRKPATFSNASLLVTNLNNTVSDEFTNLIFVDQSGTEWEYTGTIQFAANETKALVVTCKDSGAIEAPAGWIDQTLEVSYLEVLQDNAANVGSEIESDADLRARRAQSSGANGITVLDSLIGALREISGIDDVKIYNNNTGSDQTSKDGTVIEGHSIYVILRVQDGVTISEQTIGELIYEKLTPGISTTEANVPTKKMFNYVPTVMGSTITTFEQIVFWKQAVPINPNIVIKLLPKPYFTEDEIPVIAESLFEYLNSISLSDDLDQQQILIETVYADPTFKGLATYSVQSVTASNTSNPDTFYKYNKYTFVKNSDDTYDITLSYEVL